MPDEREAELAVFRDAYQLETVPVLRQRLTVAMGLFVFFMGIGTFLEVAYYPQRTRFAVLLYGIEALTAIAGAAACWLPALRERAGVVAAGTAVVLASCINLYHAHVAASAERVATVLGCILNLLSVLLPWGWVAQTIAGLGTIGSFAIAAPHLVTNDALAFPTIVLIAGATNAICGAFFLDRYRFEAFRRTALQTEAAEIAATLTHIGATLSQRLGQPDVLERVDQLAAEVLGCDWTALSLFDERRRVYWNASSVGFPAEIATELAQLEFAPESLPLLETFRPGELVEIADAADQTLVPVELMRHLGVTAAMYAPVARGEQMIGVLAAGYLGRVGPFSARQRRLMLGIAHATATTLENGRLIADLQAANRLKSEFVATMSHELRTPLNVIMGYSEMLADGTFTPEDPSWKSTIGRIQDHAVELLDLVSATLDMGRLEAGRENVTIAPVDLPALLAELGRELAPVAREGVALSWRNELGATLVSDRVKLKTVLKNLVGNALKFTTVGTVDVEARSLAGGAVFTVRDTGIGISPEHLPVIFEMFRQVDSSSTRRFGGVGLGLHIAHRLAELLGGSIEVASTPGAGSTFTVTLPLPAPRPRSDTVDHPPTFARPSDTPHPPQARER
jgi:signal transduction histidine kinase